MKPTVNVTDKEVIIKAGKYDLCYKQMPKSEDQMFVALKDNEETFRIDVDTLTTACPSTDPTLRMITALCIYLEEVKKCQKCEKDKHISQFRTHKYTYKGTPRESVKNTCNTCVNRDCYDSQKKNAYYKYWKYYKLSEATVKAIVQDGCQVCGTFDNLNIDHDHSCCAGQLSCGKCVRGVLCDRHNQAAGLLRDSTTECAKLINYLNDAEKNKEKIRALNVGATKPILPKRPRSDKGTKKFKSKL